MNCKATIFAMAIYLVVSATNGSEMSWVDFSPWNAGSLSQSGLSASNGVVLNCSFGPVSNMETGFPRARDFAIGDPAWPFSNTNITSLMVIGRSPYRLTTTLTMDFTSSGGFPAGGSIGIADLEDPSSMVTLTGMSNGSTVGVIAGEQADPIDAGPP